MEVAHKYGLIRGVKILLLFFWVLLLLIESGGIIYVILRDFRSQIPIKALLYKKLILLFTTAALIIGLIEIYIFWYALSMAGYLNRGEQDGLIIMVSTFPLFIIVGFLNAKYLTLMKSQK